MDLLLDRVRPADGAALVTRTRPARRAARAVLLVANPANPYSRGLRVARSLAAAGYDVEIAATTGDGAPAEERDGDIADPSLPADGPLGARRDGHDRRRPAPAPASVRADRRLDPARGQGPRVARPRPRLVGDASARPAAGRPLPRLRHPHDPRRARPRAGGAPAAAATAASSTTSSTSSSSRTTTTSVPRPLLAWYRRRERRWVGRSDAIVTVNQPIADHLARTWRLRTPPTVLLNAQPRWTPPTRGPT